MLPLCRRFPLSLAPAPLWLLSPASGNARRARRARIRGTPARARGSYTPVGPGALALASLGTNGTFSLPRGAPLSGWGHPSTPSPSLFTFLKVPGQPPPPPPHLLCLGGLQPTRSSLVSRTWSLTPVGDFPHFGNSGTLPVLGELSQSSDPTLRASSSHLHPPPALHFPQTYSPLETSTSTLERKFPPLPHSCLPLLFSSLYPSSSLPSFSLLCLLSFTLETLD